jgi:succinate dehydrogenase / fumarate reductase membrane anchor subunit
MATMSGTTTRTVKIPAKIRFERYAYLFMRLSGIALLLLAVGHMLLQHVLNSVHNLTLQFVATQWNSWGWKTYDMGLLVFAAVHGFNGLRNVLEDYIHNDAVMRVVNVFLLVFLILSIGWSLVAIATFDATAAAELRAIWQQ